MTDHTQGLREAHASPKFGDLVENGWASEDNPTRRGQFVRAFKRTGRLNPGLTWEITDGRGKFWTIQPKEIGERLTVTPALPSPRSREGDETAEAVAQFLHDEVDLPDKFVDGQWPLHDGDDGYRGGGYVKLQPKDIVEHYRDAAKRLVARFGFRAAQPREGDEADREKVARALCDYEWNGSQPPFDRKPKSFGDYYRGMADVATLALAERNLSAPPLGGGDEDQGETV